jgi:N6-L-threonylcarbamoyladenine synthase
LSFSGLKTAARLAVDAHRDAAGGLADAVRADLAASFQAAVVDTLADKCRAALEATGLERLVVAGGVGANRRLRAALEALGQREGVRVHYPRPALCTDNGAMIAYAGACRIGDARARGGSGPFGVVAMPRWSLEDLQPPAA